MVPDIEVYAVGFCHASVCSSLSIEETTAYLNRECPTGTSNPWVISEEETFADGVHKNPCPCDQSPETHKHYLFSC